IVSVECPNCAPSIGCPSASGRNSAPSLVSVGGIVPHHWCQCGRNSAPSLVSVGGIVLHHWCQCGRNSAPSLVSVWEE
ncbi:unnamed protein product, partial [Staurois parvus]